MIPDSGLIRTEEEYVALITFLRDNPEMVLAVDTETTGLHPYGEDTLRGISVANLSGQWYIPITHPDSHNFNGLALAHQLTVHPLVMHHMTFDVPFIERHYSWNMLTEHPILRQVVWDTQVGNWLRDENLKVGLKESAERILGFDAGEEKRALKQITKETGRRWDTFTAEDIGTYAAMDARLTYDLYRWQKDMGDDEFHVAMTREMTVQEGITRMNGTGIRVDVEHIRRMIADRESMLADMEKVFERYGVNPRSPKTVGRWLYDDLGYECKIMTKTGARSTSKAALQALAAESEEADALLRHRVLQKELTAYFRPLLRAAEHTDGIVHPHFSSTRTVTGRFSCSDPNLQTIPRDDVMSDVRKCFIPRDGYMLVEYDLNQAELRVIAGYTKEENMIAALLDPERNLHDETALAVFGPDYTGIQRRFAKNLNFGFPYGIGPQKFATYINPVPSECDYWTAEATERFYRKIPKCGHCDVCEADKILQGYRETYPSLVHYMNGLGKYADKHGRIPLEPTGRYRHFRGAGYRVPGYTALNAIVQGGIGEFMKDMMIEWYDRVFEPNDVMDCRLVLQIHDALVFEIPVRKPDGIATLRRWLQKTADRINPFDLPMIFEEKEWK